MITTNINILYLNKFSNIIIYLRKINLSYFSAKFGYNQETLKLM
jgi:hypothetical protein